MPVDVSAYVPRVFRVPDMAQALLEKAHVAVTPGKISGGMIFSDRLTSDRITVGMERMRDFVRGL